MSLSSPKENKNHQEKRVAQCQPRQEEIEMFLKSKENINDCLQ
jgi:hypothetical protein